ncbi:MAG: MoaD/ThiS family protein [bacterium]|nr:MoaD/ThiS family protein [bacterium]
MPKVFIPSLMRKLTQNREMVEIEGSTLREVINNLELQYPGFKARVLFAEETRLAPGLAAAIDGVITEEGLRTRVSPDCEIHFVTQISGG